MHLDAQGKTEDVPEVAIAITYETHGIDIIGSQLIKERNALDALTHIVRDIVSEALTEGDVRTDTGRERIIAVFILGRLLGPEIMSEDGIEIDAALQRFKPPSLTDITVPGNEILLDRECQFRIVRIKTGEYIRASQTSPIGDACHNPIRGPGKTHPYYHKSVSLHW